VLTTTGNAAKTKIGNWTQGGNLTEKGVERLKKAVFFGGLLSYTTEDSAKTQTYLSAYSELPDNTTGQFWAASVSLLPLPGFWMRYKRCRPEKLKPHAADEKNWKKFWDFCAEAMVKAKRASGVVEMSDAAIVSQEKDKSEESAESAPAIVAEKTG
jgi:hypothetical protein